MNKSIIPAAVMLAVGTVALRSPEGGRVYVQDGQPIPDFVPAPVRDELLGLRAARPADPQVLPIASDDATRAGAGNPGTNSTATEEVTDAVVSADGAAGSIAAPDALHDAEATAAAEEGQETAPAGGKARTKAKA